MNAQGQVTDAYAFDAWGNGLATVGSTVNPYRYVGKQGYYLDAESALMLLGVRYYGAANGLFLSRDLEEGYGYTYAADNPVRWVDPQGLQWEEPRSEECRIVNGQRECAPSGKKPEIPPRQGEVTDIFDRIRQACKPFKRFPRQLCCIFGPWRVICEACWDIGCMEAVKDNVVGNVNRNYPPPKGCVINDLYLHCHVACDGSKRCGAAVASYTSTLWELICLLPGVNCRFDPDDIRANHAGIYCAVRKRNCDTCCAAKYPRWIRWVGGRRIPCP